MAEKKLELRDVTLSPDQQQCLQMVFAYFSETGDWPTFRWLYKAYVRNIGSTDLQALLHSFPAAINWPAYVNPDQKIELTVERMCLCDGSESLLKEFAQVVRFCSERYLASDADEVVVTNEILRDECELPDDSVKKIGRLFFIEPNLWRAASNVAHDGSWSVTLSDDIHWFRQVTSIEDYRAVAGERAHQRELAGVAVAAALQPRMEENVRSQNTVFVAYGRDLSAQRAVFDLLRAAGLAPLEWEQAVQLTEKASPYIGEVLDAAFSKAQAAVIVLTGDEEVALRRELIESGEPAETAGLQPRPNVILEAGMALGKYPDRTILVEFGPLREMSDLLGRHVIRWENTISKRKALLNRLAIAGCSVDLSGDHWMNAGMFKRRQLKHTAPNQPATAGQNQSQNGEQPAAPLPIPPVAELSRRSRWRADER